MSPSAPTPPGTRLPSLSNTPGASASGYATAKGSFGLRSEILARRLDGESARAAPGAAFAWAGNIVATAAPAAGKTAPPQKRPRPAANILFQWVLGRCPRRAGA